MARRRLAPICLAAALATAGHAQDLDRVSSAGHSYIVDCNEDGYVLTSRYPVGRFLGSTGASTRVEVETETLYLGRSCDAFHPKFGQGQWERSNGGFVLEFNNLRIGFPRQDLDCPIPDQDIGGCFN